MRNKVNKLLIAASTGFITNPVLAAPLSAHLTPHQVMVRFCIVMGLVLVSSLLIFMGLKVAKRTKTIAELEKGMTKKSPFQTPETTIEAVDFYINKNRL